MTTYDLVDEAVIHAPPDVVWRELIEELSGARRWWVPANTFVASLRSPELVGGRTHVTVHPNGVDAGGPKLTFTSRTREVEPGRRLLGDYVSGVFRGTNEFRLEAVDGGRHTLLSMAFRARAHGWVRLLGRLTDVGREHSKATRAAFATLDAVVGAHPRAALPAAEAGTGASTRTVRTDDDAELAVTVLGPPVEDAAPTVVLAHGWAATGAVWDAVAGPLLALGFTVVRYDLRGHGASSQGREHIDLARHAADLGTVLAALDVKNAVLVGHSGGAFAALELLAGDPDAAARLRGLLLLGAAAHDQDTAAGEVRMMGSELFTRALSVPALGRRLLRATMGRDPRYLDTVRRMFAATPADVRADCFRSSRGMDLRRALPAVAVPAVVLAGGRDTVVAPRLGETIAALLRDARYERLDGVGHMVPLETPDRVALAVVELAAGA